MPELGLENTLAYKVTSLQLSTNARAIFQEYFFYSFFCLPLDTVQCLQLTVCSNNVRFLKKLFVEENAPILFAIITRNPISIEFGIHLEEFSC